MLKDRLTVACAGGCLQAGVGHDVLYWVYVHLLGKGESVEGGVLRKPGCGGLQIAQQALGT